MIRTITNPLTQEYLSLKKFILSNEFPWFYSSFSTRVEKDGHFNLPFYSHAFLKRPETSEGKYPTATSPYLDQVSIVCQQILNTNGIKFNTFLRLNLNCTHPQEKLFLTVPHCDHPFPHLNLLVYFSDGGGKTYTEEENYTPVEDGAIILEGDHYYEVGDEWPINSLPLERRRVVLVATLI